MCNLKSTKNIKEILEYKKQLEKINLDNKTVVLFPSSIYFPFFYDAKYFLGSQNISIYQNGSFTGEILASQLASLRVSYVMINHCEMSDTEENNILKIKNATQEKITVVFCIGKNINPKENIIEKLKMQIKNTFDSLTKEERENIIIAYEPCWAIHSKNIISKEDIQEVTIKIKEYVSKEYSGNNKMIYGGSISLENIDALLKIDILDGYLIGYGASNAKNVLKIAVKF